MTITKPLIYVIKKEKSLSKQEFDFLISFVDENKKERILNQEHIEDAENILLADILVKIAIKQIFGISIMQQKYSTYKNGKPFLINQKDIHFNLSHSGKYIVCAIYNSEIGVDIQKIEFLNKNLVNYICNEEEKVCNDSEFSKLWSQKEAVLKKNALGLAGDIKNCLENQNVQSIQIEDYWLSISI